MLSIVVSLVGCGSNAPTAPTQATTVKEEYPPPPPPPSPAELLKEPRDKLAQRCLDLLSEMRIREQARKEGRLKFALLDVYLPQAWPAFQDMKYLPEVGVSVPPYADMKDKARERDLWIHYARFGDHEAALKLAGPEISPQLESLKTEKSYPVEWTRMAAMQVRAFEQRLAIGEEDVLAALVDWHTQVEKALDAKAKQGALGQALLPRGRQTLKQAAIAWRNKGQMALAERAEKALAEWVTPAEPTPVPTLQEPKSYWVQALKGKAEGRVLSSQPPLRAFDLLQIPFPAESADAVLLGFSDKDRLTDILVTYAPRARSDYSLPADMAGVLSEWAPPTKESTPELCLQQWGNLNFQTSLCRQGPTLGALVRITVGPGEGQAAVPRDIGAIHLNRSFEQHRLQLAPTRLQQGDVMKLDQAKELDRVKNPLTTFRLQDVVLRRVPNRDLLADARLYYPLEQTRNVPLHQLAFPLFARLGLGQVTDEAAARAQAAHVRVAWEDAQTRVVLRMPHGGTEPVSLELADARDQAMAASERELAVAVHENNERQQRAKEGKLIQRLPRKLEQFSLGMLRKDVLAFLPQGQAINKREFADGVNVVINTPPPKGQIHMVRQLTVRFDKAGRLFWARARYEPVVTTQSRGKDWKAPILAPWWTQGGAIASGPSPIEARMTDLPAQTPTPTFYRWQDDVTEATYYLDRSGAEVTLQDRPIASNPEALAPLSLLPRGPEKFPLELALGEKRDDVEKKLEGQPETTADGTWVVRPTRGPFDAVLLWFEDDRVQRIAARYRLGATANPAPKDMEKSLRDRWGAELKTIGWPTRFDFTPNNELQSLTWFDDATRYHLYWAESDNSPSRLWSEWRDDAKR